MRRLGILALLLLGIHHPAQAQTSCSVLSQSQLLSSFSDTAPAGSITPRNMRDLVCSSALQLSSLTPIGSSLYPTAVPSIQTTCAITSGSANATCPAGLAITAGDTVFPAVAGDIPLDGGIWPTVVSYDPVAGGTVFTTAATVTNASESLRFGSGQRYDLNSTILANSIFGKALKLGDAAQDNTWWADNNPGYTSNLTNTGPSLAVGSNGNIISGLFATHAAGANSWHQIALDILGRADATALVSGHTNSTWGIYLQLDTVASSAPFTNSIGNELEVTNRWGIVDIDPYIGAVNNTTNDIGLGCGGGQTDSVAWGTISPCTLAMEIFSNGFSFRQGIMFTPTALDTSSGRIAPALSLAKNQAIDFWGVTGHPQWQIYNNSNSAVQDNIILGINTLTMQGDTSSAFFLTVQSQGAFQSNVRIDTATAGQDATEIYLDAGVLKWKLGKRGSDGAFEIFDIVNAANIVLVTPAGAATFGEPATVTRVQGSTVTLAPTTNLQITGIPTSGTAAGSLCITAGGVVFEKTTTGPCL